MNEVAHTFVPALDLDPDLVHALDQDRAASMPFPVQFAVRIRLQRGHMEATI